MTTNPKVDSACRSNANRSHGRPNTQIAERISLKEGRVAVYVASPKFVCPVSIACSVAPLSPFPCHPQVLHLMLKPAVSV